MVESSLGISNVRKVIKEKKRKRKSTQNKSKTLDDFGERCHMTVSCFLLFWLKVLTLCITQTSFWFSVREVYLVVHEGDQEHQILFCALIFFSGDSFRMLAFSICFRGPGMLVRFTESRSLQSWCIWEWGWLPSLPPFVLLQTFSLSGFISSSHLKNNPVIMLSLTSDYTCSTYLSTQGYRKTAIPTILAELPVQAPNPFPRS